MIFMKIVIMNRIRVMTIMKNALEPLAFHYGAHSNALTISAFICFFDTGLLYYNILPHRESVSERREKKKPKTAKLWVCTDISYFSCRLIAYPCHSNVIHNSFPYNVILFLRWHSLRHKRFNRFSVCLLCVSNKNRYIYCVRLNGDRL